MTQVEFQLGSLQQSLCLSGTLETALSRAKSAADVIVHSDQSWHYKMQPYRAMLASHGVKQSMSRKGN